MSDQTRYPSQVVAVVAERLSGYLDRYEERRDPRSVFAYLYSLLTEGLRDALGIGQPHFDDPAWVADLATTLSNEYFSAMDAIDAWIDSSGARDSGGVSASDLPQNVPEPWREVYVASNGRRSYVLEDAIFSMMAHISYDLPNALRRMSDYSDVRTHIADFHLMNDVLGSTIEGVQEALASRYSKWLAYADQLFVREDELLSNYGIRVARGMAWYNFDRLSDPRAAVAAERSIRTSTGGLIRQIREPEDWRLRTALHTARLLIPERRHWPR